MVNFYGADKSITGTTPQASNVLPAVLKEERPEVEHISRVLWASRRLVANGQNSFRWKGVMPIRICCGSLSLIT